MPQEDLIKSLEVDLDAPDCNYVPTNFANFFFVSTATSNTKKPIQNVQLAN